MTDPLSIAPTSEQLRGLSHPVRIQLLGLLRMDGPQTSADLARATGLNTGATSYHLRQLSQHGFIEDAPDLGTGRERVWRARHRSTQPLSPTEGPGAGATLDDQSAWQQTVVTWTAGALQAAHDEWTELPETWRRVSRLNDYLLRLTADQAAEVLDQLDTTLRALAASPDLDADPAAVPTGGSGLDGRELFEVHLLAFPVPGRLPHRDER